MSGLTYDRAVAGDPAAPALIGVSGGRDSVALLHALWGAGFRQLVVCHFDHVWRAESADDAAFVRGLAERYELAFESDRWTAPVTREAAARDARYAFFARVAARRGVQRLLLAHHADDQVETFLFNLLRGAAGPGLAGMQPVSRRWVGEAEIEIARPLLGCRREEIDAYIEAERLAFREDASNADPRHTRNRVRSEVLAYLSETLGRPVHGALWKAATVLAAENEYFSALPELGGIGAELDVRTLRAMHVAVQRRVIFAWLHSHQITAIGFDEVEAVRGLIHSDSPAKTNLPGDRHARRRAGKLFIE